MPQTDFPMPGDDAPPAATFYLDEEPSEEEEHERNGFHVAGRSRLPQFLLGGCVLLLMLALALGTVLQGWGFVQEHYWALLLWAVLVFLIYRFQFRRRPRFQITGDGLSLRTEAHRAERRVAWDDLTHVDFAFSGRIVLHRQPGGPIYLALADLSDERTHALRKALAEAARARGVPVED